MKEYGYLTEEELELLIRSAEEETIAAPDDLLENILAAVSGEPSAAKNREPEAADGEIVLEVQKPPKIAAKNKQKAEFRRYCLQIITSAAAAIALMFAVPAFSDSGRYEVPDKRTVVEAGRRTKAEAVADAKAESELTAAIRQSHMVADLLENYVFK